MTNKITIEDYLDKEYKSYAMYVIENRAIPNLTDGLKIGQRRVMWVAKEVATNFIKAANFAGQTMKYHPHGNVALEDTIGKMSQDFTGANNYPLLTGDGAFGNKVIGAGGAGIGAARYVSVKISEFAKKNLYVDMDLLNLIPNYDGEYTECQHFLPLIPMALVNGIQGIAVGFATEILPYKLSDIVHIQEMILNGKKIKSNQIPLPWFKGFKGTIYKDEEGNIKTRGVYELKGKLDLHITELPIGYNKEHYNKVLDDLQEKGYISDFEDNCKKEFDFTIKIKKGSNLDDNQIVKLFKLESGLSQNLTFIDTKGKLKTYNNIVEVFEEFTNWRFSFYKKRYQLYKEKLNEVIAYNSELLKFIKFVIDNDYLKTLSKKSKKQTTEDLNNRKFKYVDRLMNVPIYNFTGEKIKELEDKINEDKKQVSEYTIIIESEDKQKSIFNSELKKILDI